MQINRQDLLNRLLMISPGILAKGPLQSDCVVLRRGWLYTLSREIACAIPSRLGDLDAAIPAARVIDYLKNIKSEEIEFTIENNTLTIRGDKRERASFATPDTVKLPIDAVERPKADEYAKLSPKFERAVDMTIRCTQRRQEFLKACVHLQPAFLEGSDNTKLIRFPIDNAFLKGPILVRGESLKTILKNNMTRGGETADWVHFINAIGLRISIRKWDMGKYPNFNSVLKERGQPLEIPSEVLNYASTAGIFADDIDISLDRNQLVVSARDSDGEYEKVLDSNYTGEPIRFRIPPRLIADLLDKGTKCEVLRYAIRVDGDGFTYMAGFSQ